MAKQVDFSVGTVVTDAWLDDMQEVDSAAAWGIRMEPQGSPATGVVVKRAVDGSATGQSGARINGLMRYFSGADLTLSLAGQAANTYSIYLVAGAASPPTLAFAVGAGPANSRKIGEAVWNGTKITELRNMVDAVGGHGYLHRPGGPDPLEFARAYTSLAMTNFLAGGSNELKYTKDPVGNVHVAFNGAQASSPAPGAGATLCTFPTGYRPTFIACLDLWPASGAGGPTKLTVDASGVLRTTVALTASAFYDLSGTWPAVPA